MLEALAALVEVESPSSDTSATARCAELADDIGSELLGAPAERIVIDERMQLRWSFGARIDVLLVGHVDTVWPVGTLARSPFTVEGDKAIGPGSFDMKGGVVQLFYALNALDDLDGVEVLLTTDEEIGSPSSRELIRETVKGARAALVLEPSADGALKTARKGVSTYLVEVKGRSAHAGLEPEKGINATVEIAHQILAIEALARPDIGTTVTPSIVSAGSSTNSIPSDGSIYVDVRVPTVEEGERVHSSLMELTPQVPGSSLRTERKAGSPPMPESSSADLFVMAQKIASTLGIEAIEGVSVGGGSDGNITADAGVPTLDGLGAVGDGAHAEGEHLIVSKMPERAALVAGIVQEILST